MPVLSYLKVCNVRGKLGAELNEKIAYLIDSAYSQHLNARRMMVADDMSCSTALPEYAQNSVIMKIPAKRTFL